MSNLRQLYLHNNRLTGIPPESEKLRHPEELYLHNNRLTRVPEELGRLSNLQILTLNDNQLTRVPAELGNLRDLKRLDLDNNHLTSIPMKLGRLTHLESLGVDGNEDLTSPPPEVVRQGTEAILAHLRNGLKKSPKEVAAIKGLSGKRRSRGNAVGAVRRAERI